MSTDQHGPHENRPEHMGRDQLVADLVHERGETRRLREMYDGEWRRAEKAEGRARAACQTLISAFGSVGPENVEDAAKRAAEAYAKAMTRIADLEKAIRDGLGWLHSERDHQAVEALQRPLLSVCPPQKKGE